MDWTSHFSGLSKLEESNKAMLLEKSSVIDVPKDTVLFGPGTEPENLMLLLNGTVRVQQVSEAGREIILYRIYAGESCIMTTACLLAFEDYSAQGIAETDLQAVAIPRELGDQMLANSEQFRQFVFSAFAKRITDLFTMVEEVAFQRLDVRLAQKLVELANEGAVVLTTHQELSIGIGTAREVISRQLGEFQRRNWIQQSRGSITLLDPQSLIALSSA